jgi:quinol monooxygenase YgiN
MEINRRTLLAGGAALTALPCIAGEVSDHGIAKSDMPKTAILMAVIVKAKAGQEDAVKEALLGMVEPTRKEAGCLCYNLHRSKSDSAQFMFYEQWASKETLDAHGKTPRMKALGEKLKDRTENVSVTFYELLK